MVRRFYATLEVNMVNETIKWMTRKGKFKATLGSFLVLAVLIMT
jgi:hypothetical protein